MVCLRIIIDFEHIASYKRRTIHGVVSDNHYQKESGGLFVWLSKTKGKRGNEIFIGQWLKTVLFFFHTHFGVKYFEECRGWEGRGHAVEKGSDEEEEEEEKEKRVEKKQKQKQQDGEGLFLFEHRSIINTLCY